MKFATPEARRPKEAAVLLAALLAVAAAGCRSAERRATRETEWACLSEEIERPPIHGFALHWKSVYERLCALGIEPSQARENVRRAAHVGPSAAELHALLDRAKGAGDAQEALDLAYAERLDARRRRAAREDGYVHLPLIDTYVELQWRALQSEIEAPPIHGSALHWRPIFDALCARGLPPRKAHEVVLHAASVGPSHEEIDRMLTQVADTDALVVALDLRYYELRDARRGEQTELSGYRHTEPPETDAEVHWRRLSMEVDAPPSMQSALKWRPIYRTLCARGVAPPHARALLRRSARIGPEPREIEMLLDAHRDDVRAFLTALTLRHAELLDARWEALASLDAYGMRQTGSWNEVEAPRPPAAAEGTDGGNAPETAAPAGATGPEEPGPEEPIAPEPDVSEPPPLDLEDPEAWDQ